MVTCNDCPCCEILPGRGIGLCWRPYDGPQVISTAQAGRCGYELVDADGKAPEGISSRELWMAYHKRSREDLNAILMLLRFGRGPSERGETKDALARVVAQKQQEFWDSGPPPRLPGGCESLHNLMGHVAIDVVLEHLGIDPNELPARGALSPATQGEPEAAEGKGA